MKLAAIREKLRSGELNAKPAPAKIELSINGAPITDADAAKIDWRQFADPASKIRGKSASVLIIDDPLSAGEMDEIDKIIEETEAELTPLPPDDALGRFFGPGLKGRKGLMPRRKL